MPAHPHPPPRFLLLGAAPRGRSRDVRLPEPCQLDNQLNTQSSLNLSPRTNHNGTHLNRNEHTRAIAKHPRTVTTNQPSQKQNTASLGMKPIGQRSHRGTGRWIGPGVSVPPRPRGPTCIPSRSPTLLRPPTAAASRPRRQRPMAGPRGSRPSRTCATCNVRRRHARSPPRADQPRGGSSGQPLRRRSSSRALASAPSRNGLSSSARASDLRPSAMSASTLSACSSADFGAFSTQ